MGQYGQIPGRMGLGSGHPSLALNGVNSNMAAGAPRGAAMGLNAVLSSGRPGLDRGGSAGMAQSMVGMGSGAVSAGFMGMRQGSAPAQGMNPSMNGPGRISNVSVNQLNGQFGGLGLQNSSAGLRVPNLGGMAGGGMPGGQGNPYNPSGDLLAMINKAGLQSTAMGGMLGKASSMDPQAAMASAGLGGQQRPLGAEAESPFDASDFPTLGDSGSGAPAADRGPGHADPGFGSAESYPLSSGQKPHSEFSMQNEDFPALPSSTASSLNQRGEEVSGMSGSLQPGGTAGASAGYDLWSQQQGGPKGGQAASGGGPDRFGILGLLPVIRMTDPDLTTLALGTDLTTLGLNLNSPENLYKTFASPWADAPARAEPEYHVPACYLHTPPRLKPGYLSKFMPETLFYIFYSMPGDEAQLYAADELANRGWWYHKEWKMWLTRVPNTETTAKSDRFERSSFYVFDTNTWEMVRKDSFGLSYDSLERPPNLIRTSPQPGMQGMQPPPPAPK
uniref:CCR4-NOT transcription complex subunit 2 n=1 Tax=Tetraselmis sp. GSL018 TaxID=582737 RepID=A0A061QVX4_9CHLO